MVACGEEDRGGIAKGREREVARGSKEERERKEREDRGHQQAIASLRERQDAFLVTAPASLSHSHSVCGGMVDGEIVSTHAMA